MEIVVRKYGGTSVADARCVLRAASSVAAVHATGTPIVVVVSAQGGTTDDLLRRSAELGSAVASRETDQLLATGECASAALLALALAGLGVPAVSLTGAQARIRVTGPPGAGLIVAVDTARIRRHLARGEVVVVAGFQGVNDAGDLVTLGRGGSDTTAVALAVALDAAACEIYTDVQGVYSADPRVVDDARLLPTLRADVTVELAFAGAAVLHARAAELAAARDIEVHVRGAFTDRPGTRVVPRGGVPGQPGVLENDGAVTAVTHDPDAVRVLIRAERPRRDPAADLLTVLAEHNAPLDPVARSGPFEDEFRMGFTLRGTDLDRLAPALHAAADGHGATVVLDQPVAKVSVVGVGLLSRAGSTAQVLTALAGAGIPTSWLFTSQLRTSVTVPPERAREAVAVLHRALLTPHDPPMASAGHLGSAP